MRPLYKDPIVEEMRRNSRRLAARFDYDIERLGEYLRQRELESGAQLVDLSALNRKKLRHPATVHRVPAPKRP